MKTMPTLQSAQLAPQGGDDDYEGDDDDDDDDDDDADDDDGKSDVDHMFMMPPWKLCFLQCAVVNQNNHDDKDDCNDKDALAQ